MYRGRRGLYYFKCIIERSFRHLEAEMEAAQGKWGTSMLLLRKGSFGAHCQTAGRSEGNNLLGMHVIRWLLLSRTVGESNESQIKVREKDAHKDTEVILYASLPFTSLGTFQRNQCSCIFSLLFPASMWQHDSVFISVSSFYYVFLFSASCNLQRMSQLW